MAATVLLQVDSDNRQIVTAEGLALFFGVSVEEVLARSGGTTAETATMDLYPPEWIQAGQRRAREAAAAVGENDLTRVLCYWANKAGPTEVLVVSRSAAREG